MENEIENNFLQLWAEKVKDKGEDSKPIYLSSKNKSVVGVCDGMGGAGSKLYTNEKSDKSGAALAAVTVSKVVKDYCLKIFNKNEKLLNIDELKNLIIQGLREIDLVYKERQKTQLKSKLMSPFPTTLAFLIMDEDKNQITRVISIWAGDSRNFALNKNGLLQLSKDDLRINNDALENIYNDSPLSNFISLGSNFNLNQKTFEFEEASIFLSATDGCFQFFSSPMHFELMLLETMLLSSNMEEWNLNISTILKDLAGDDYSMGLKAIAFENFNTIKEYFKKRYEILVSLLKNIDVVEEQLLKMQNAIKDKKIDIEKFKALKKDMLLQVWEGYKKEYYKNINDHA